ncbi:hypothetical protein BN7_1640 [Wickerhamomyces ciferrii]|uniref:Uncharacterized protein n=1 Tax=Wickerhamomyces ciferrii (strain ATCC 14091 / BCRC 22168 / CBS 111 / JCM 3599 / NBRC 0793 / NRRL Y-1031 F-60-10) TaxID=1206466 RepID=K0KLU6_WICCF|nr:uncharacterized protein BN7_1640 [Wickerhamomyces ciferrii]CCH42098.1 hypothetical protein BN7_1640 [Wickerhamomyces ciferrii]
MADTKLQELIQEYKTDKINIQLEISRTLSNVYSLAHKVEEIDKRLEDINRKNYLEKFQTQLDNINVEGITRDHHHVLNKNETVNTTGNLYTVGNYGNHGSYDNPFNNGNCNACGAPEQRNQHDINDNEELSEPVRAFIGFLTLILIVYSSYKFITICL